MTPQSRTKQSVNVRVANFSGLDTSFEHVLNFDNHDIQATVTEIRKYADLPYVYIFSNAQKNHIVSLLSELKSIRSTCYPHALFFIGEGEPNHSEFNPDELDLDIITIANPDSETLSSKIKEYAFSKFIFDKDRLKNENHQLIPEKVDVLIVGAGITGLYAANILSQNNISFCVVEKRDIIGGIWSDYANSTSQVNTSEGAYRLIENKIRSNRDHSMTREILEDMEQLARNVFDDLFLTTQVGWIKKVEDGYEADIIKNEKKLKIKSKGVILAINDRVGSPRTISWSNQDLFNGKIVTGTSDEAKDIDWKNKYVVIVGMGAFAVENARTALEGGASQVTVVCRRHGTVCPKIIDYLNFSTPYNDTFEHDKKSNMRNMMLWKKLYNYSGATQPECWMGKIKHTGHTISVSDIWFIGHYLKKIETIAGRITGMFENGIIVDDQHHIEADVVVNCVGFHRNAVNVKNLCDYTEMYNNNYIDKDMMYLADAFIDDDVFNSFFGSSVLEMAKFYMDVYVKFFNNPEFENMLVSEGIEKLSIEERSWSHYNAGAISLIDNYPDINEIAKKQVAQRTHNFIEAHDLETYIAENKREWIDTHSLLAGKPMKEEDCLPYVFEKLISNKI